MASTALFRKNCLPLVQMGTRIVVDVVLIFHNSQAVIIHSVTIKAFLF